MDELLVFETNPSAINIHLLAIAYSQIMDGLPDAAALTLAQIAPSSLPNEFSNLLENLLRESYKPSSPVLTVGLAVPLTGKNANLGKSFFEGFRAHKIQKKLNNRRLSRYSKRYKKR